VIAVKRNDDLSFKFTQNANGRFVIVRPVPNCAIGGDHASCSHPRATFLIKSANKALFYTFKSPDKLEQLLNSKKAMVIETERPLEIAVKDDRVKVTKVKLWLNYGLKFLRHPPKSGASFISVLKMVILSLNKSMMISY